MIDVMKLKWKLISASWTVFIMVYIMPKNFPPYKIYRNFMIKTEKVNIVLFFAIITQVIF